MTKPIISPGAATEHHDVQALAPSSILFAGAPQELSRRVGGAGYGFAAAGVVVVVVALASFVTVGLVTSVAL